MKNRYGRRAFLRPKASAPRFHQSNGSRLDNALLALRKQSRVLRHRRAFADCFGANPVASALGNRPGCDPGAAVRTYHEGPKRVLTTGTFYFGGNRNFLLWSDRMPRDTLLDFFHDFAGLEDEFLIHDDGFHARHFRYREIAERARAFAARLREQGIGRDDKVILYGENRPEWIIALWGCLLEGVIAVPIDYRSSRDFVDRIQNIVGARLVLTGEEAWHVRRPSARGVQPAGVYYERSNRRDHFHFGRHGRAEGRDHHAPQHSRQYRSRGK